jgi:hypothetical protein
MLDVQLRLSQNSQETRGSPKAETAGRKRHTTHHPVLKTLLRHRDDLLAVRCSFDDVGNNPPFSRCDFRFAPRVLGKPFQKPRRNSDRRQIDPAGESRLIAIGVRRTS